MFNDISPLKQSIKRTGLTTPPVRFLHGLPGLLFVILLFSSASIADLKPGSIRTQPQTPFPEPDVLVHSVMTNAVQSPADFSEFGGANTQQDSHDRWRVLREQYFMDRPIIEKSDNRIRLQAPGRAENDAMVPVLIDLDEHTVQADDPFEKVYLIVDVNPLPLGGLFRLSNNRVMEQLKTSVRVNGYTFIRAVGETASGKLYMAKQWVKSTGAGCSAPPGLDQEMHKKRLGKIRFDQIENDKYKHSRSLRLIVSHPNNTGMQKDQLTTLFIPEHYITKVNVTFNQELLLQADTSFTISENPNFTFTFDPEESGILRAELTDNLENFFSQETYIQGNRELKVKD